MRAAFAFDCSKSKQVVGSERCLKLFQGSKHDFLHWYMTIHVLLIQNFIPDINRWSVK